MGDRSQIGGIRHRYSIDLQPNQNTEMVEREQRQQGLSSEALLGLLGSTVQALRVPTLPPDGSTLISNGKHSREYDDEE
jgi:hypothetical protein